MAGTAFVLLEQLVAVFLLRGQGVAIAFQVTVKRAIWRDQRLFELGNGVVMLSPVKPFA